MANDQNRKPSHDICHIKDTGNDKGHWTTIGAAWMHKDDKGLNLEFDFFPLDVKREKNPGRIVIRLREAKPQQQAEQS